ncbi:class I SAM-dependent DNA methyltransferase [Halobaculum sp. MBLA0143]|uniref:HsdM family class I SAM-dependent methyltransferase n=1 Tax=Halobaculum sp. MBLA0143 TaxID=3079933 RepID=UPI003526A9F4
MSDVDKLRHAVEDVGYGFEERLQSAATVDTEAVLDRLGLEEANSPDETVSVLCAFNLLLKSTLYRRHREEFESLDPLEDPKEIVSDFRAAASQTGDDGLDPWKLDELAMHLDTEAFERLLDSRDELVDAADPTRLIGELFERLVVQSARRRQGQFYTSSTVSELMARWAVRDGDDTILDPGVGTGVLSASAFEAKRRQGGKRASVEDLYGVDLSPLAVTMAATGLKLDDGVGAPNLEVTDFMDACPRGSETTIGQQDPVALPEVDAIVSNPPYSRSGALDDDRKRFNRIVDARAGLSVTEHTPLYVYFFAHATQFLREQGRMTFLTPARFCDTNYGERLRSFLLEQFHVRGVIFLESGLEAFDGARVTPCVTLLERDPGETTAPTTFLSVEHEAEPATILDCLEAEPSGPTAFGYARTLEQAELEADEDWRNYVRPDSLDSLPELRSFGEIADIKRGIATGMNDFFCLTRADVEAYGLDEEYLVRTLRRTDGMEALRVDEDHWERRRDAGETVWLLYCYDEDGNPVDRDADDALAAYLDRGEELGARDTHLAGSRSPWYAVDRRDPPDILATYMSKSGFDFFVNEADVRTLNNLHNVYLHDGDADAARAVLAYLNSTVADRVTRHLSRKYADDLGKLEISDLEDVPVIDPAHLTESQVETLSSAFEQLCDSIAAGEDVEAAREELDAVVEDALDRLPSLAA